GFNAKPSCWKVTKSLLILGNTWEHNCFANFRLGLLKSKGMTLA
ncbi:MAG: hypothetical protein RIS76_2552, partial [Verrucomicrobiota bacterium]